MKEIQYDSENVKININSNNIFFIFILIQLLLLGTIGLDSIGISIPFVRQVIGFIYLTFVPGFIILGLLKFKKLNIIETISFCIGLSLSCLIFFTTLINFCLPLFGILQPMKEDILAISLCIFLTVLFYVYYLYNRTAPIKYIIDLRKVASPSVLSILFLPIISVIGTYILNFYDRNFLLVDLLIIIPIVIFLLISSTKKELYPFAIWAICLSLFFHWSLITMYIPISDGIFEYSFSKMVLLNGFWNPKIASGTNSLLVVTVLNPLYSNICGLNLTWIYKIVVPLLMSIVPVGLYGAYCRYFEDKIAFIACFFFFSAYSYFSWIAMTMKQTTAYIFIMLMVLVISKPSKPEKDVKNSFLFIVFSLSLAISHYGTAYLFMALISASLLSYYIYYILGINILSLKYVNNRSVALYGVFIIAWYLFTSNSVQFTEVVQLVHTTIINTLDFTTESSKAYIYVENSSHLPLSLQIRHYLYYLVLFFEGIGILSLFNKSKFKNININEYFLFAIFSFCMNFVIILPVLTTFFSIDRIFNFSTIFLAPFCVIGIIITLKILLHIFRISFIDNDNLTKVASVFFICFMLFETGIVSSVVLNDYYFSSSVSYKDILENGNGENKNRLYSDYMIESDVQGARWLGEHKNSNIKVYSDYMGTYPLEYYGGYLTRLNRNSISLFKPLTSRFSFEGNSYIYLRYSNMIDGIISYNLSMSASNTSDYYFLLNKTANIYDNGGCEINCIK